MNRDIRAVLVPLLALVGFALVVAQTLSALRTAGIWTRGPHGHAALTADPLAGVDALLADGGSARDTLARDPFGLLVARAAAPVRRVVARRPIAPPAPERPLLTAIVFDADPRALLRWKGRDWTVRPGGLFDEFQVIAITRDQVTLRQGDQTLVLTRKPQGD